MNMPLIRRLLLALALLAVSIGNSYAQNLNPAYAPGVRFGFQFQNWGTQLPGASVDMGFASGNYYGCDTSCLSVSNSGGYAQTVAGNWVSFGNNIPRITDQGLLVEEARTNSIRNNSMQGALAGSPGTAPTNWTISTSFGRSVVGTGTANGIDYIDVRVQVTGGGGGTVNPFFAFETVTGVAASTGQTWANSVFVSLVGGTLANISNFNIRWSENDSGGTSVVAANESENIVSTVTSQPRRYSGVRTLSGGVTVAALQPLLRMTLAAGDVDATFRIGWPQLELGAFVTSPIRTTTVSVTRNADVITLNGAAATAAQNSKAAYFETNLAAFNTAPRFVEFNGGGIMQFATTTAVQMNNVASSANANATLGSGSIAGLVKSAFGYDATSLTARANAGTQAITVAVWGSPASTLTIGNNGSGIRALNGYMRRIGFGATKGSFDNSTN